MVKEEGKNQIFIRLNTPFLMRTWDKMAHEKRKIGFIWTEWFGNICCAGSSYVTTYLINQSPLLLLPTRQVFVVTGYKNLWYLFFFSIKPKKERDKINGAIDTSPSQKGKK